MERFESYDSEDTKAATSASDENTTEYIMDDIEIDRLSSESFSESEEIDYVRSCPTPKPRPQSLMLKKCIQQRCCDDFVLLRRENSDPVTTSEKNKCMHLDGTVNSPTSINLMSLVQFIRMKSHQSRAVRFPNFHDTESAENNPDQRSPRSSSRSSTTIFNCYICFENHHLSDSCSYAGCQENHKFCRQCLSSFLILQIRDGVVVHKCPFESCQQVAQDQDIASLVDAASFEKYRRFRQMKINPTYRECTFCGRQICIPSDFFEDVMEEKIARQPTLTCSACGTATCFYHGDAHPHESCQAYTARIRKQDLASRKLLSRIARRCPQCKAETEKFGGCNHMTCQYCSADWCWLCGKSLSGEEKLFHYDPTDLFNACAGNQFTTAPVFAWWSVWDRYESNEDALSSDGAPGSLGHCFMRSLNRALQLGYAALNVGLTCLLLGTVGIVFCSVAALTSAAMLPMYLLAEPIFQLHRSCLRLSSVYASLATSRCSGEVEEFDGLAEFNLRQAFIDAVQVVAYLAALTALAPLQILWLPWALVVLLADTWCAGAEISRLDRELIVGRLFSPSVKVLTVFRLFFDHDEDELM